MNTKCSFLVSFFALFLSYFGISQEIIEKNYFDSNKKIGGDINLKSSIVTVEGSKTYKIFEFESPDYGEYFMNAWLSGCETDGFKSGEYLEYNVSVNDTKLEVQVKPKKSGWHNESLPKTVKLNKGLNQIAFSCDAPAIPEIDFIRLSQEKSRAEISESDYVEFLEQIYWEIQERIKNPKQVSDSSKTMLKSTVLPNPNGNYYHYVDVFFRYTTYKTYSFTSGQQVFVSTYAPDGYQHVLEMFSSSNPASYTWVAMSNSNGLASLNVSIPSTGLYYIRIRAYRQTTQGLVDLNVNGQYYFEDCPVSGTGASHPHETPTTYNYFTCKLTGDSRIWIEDDSGLPGKIRAFNDDYSGGGGDFAWGLSSRVKKDFSVRISATLLSAYSSYSPTGTCDLYIKCMNSIITSSFPNLKADDAIQSAPSSSLYNCISWSGGITSDWYWPPSPYDPYYTGSPLASFDNFYGVVRYTNAMTYSRTGATSSNNTVDLWALTGNYTHGSVTKPGNNHPHGYDWESKPGSLMRTFHPRNALNGSSYGAVDKYYKITSGLKSAMLLDESVARGLSVIENVELTMNERQVLSESIDRLSLEQKSNLETKYDAWKKTWNELDIAIHSNPRMYANNKEYKDFIEYCEDLGEESWPFIFGKFEQGDFFVINALEDLTLEDNMDILEEVKADNSLKSTTTSGAIIVRSPRINAMKYIKELLKSTGEIAGTENEGIIYSNSFNFNVYPNPANITSKIAFHLPYDAKVSVELIDLGGKVLSVPLSNQLLTQGNYNYQLNVPENFNGTCLVKLLINNNLNVQLLVIE